MAIGKKADFQNQWKLNKQVFEQNKELAAFENSLNVAQWERENAYNTPEAQAQRLIQAGLNPDMVIQGLGGTSAPSPHLVGGTPMETFDVSKFTANQIGKLQTGMQAITGISDTLLKKKQGDLLDAQISNIEADTERKTYDLGFDKEIRPYRVGQEKYSMELAGVNVQVGRKSMQFTDKQMEVLNQNMEESKKRIEEINQGMEESQARISNLKVDERIKLIEEYFKPAEMRKQLAALGANIRLVNSQAYASETSNMYLGQKYVYELLGIAQDANNKDAQFKLYNAQTKQINQQYGQTAKWDDIERGTNIIVDIQRNAAEFVKGIGEIIPG